MKMKMHDKTTKPHNPILEGFGDLCVALTAPKVMRDCVRARYWNTPHPAEIFKAAGRLADDFKRRGFSQEQALAFIQQRFTETLTLKPEGLKQIQSKVAWVYTKQEHGLTCTGALEHEGLCFRTAKGCRFHDEDTANRKAVIERNPIALPHVVATFLDGHHPSESVYARWTYTEFIYLERDLGLVPGDFREPILIGFRSLAARVAMRNKAPGYSKHSAVAAVRLLGDCGLVHQVVKGQSGAMRRKANGYIRVLPISPKYNPESRNSDSICVQE